mmetsp:Transcript_24597/g.36103  ORF Transcript_24597/g.36103 Transcript_24597/m.36103 type:complete len:209 (-) Transcript_24597:351-977(-)
MDGFLEGVDHTRRLTELTVWEGGRKGLKSCRRWTLVLVCSPIRDALFHSTCNHNFCRAQWFTACLKKSSRPVERTCAAARRTMTALPRHTQVAFVLHTFSGTEAGSSNGSSPCRPSRRARVERYGLLPRKRKQRKDPTRVETENFLTYMMTLAPDEPTCFHLVLIVSITSSCMGRTPSNTTRPQHRPRHARFASYFRQPARMMWEETE